MIYLMWFDDDPKKSDEQKIQNAMQAYARRFGEQPSVVLVHPSVAVHLPDVRVRPAHHVLRHTFWAGVDGEESATRTLSAHANQSDRDANAAPHNSAASAQRTDQRAATHRRADSVPQPPTGGGLRSQRDTTNKRKRAHG